MDKKGRRRTTLSDIDEQIEQLKAKRRHMVQQRAERFAKIAAQAGLADVDISDDEALAFKSCTLRNRCRAGPGRARMNRGPGSRPQCAIRCTLPLWSGASASLRP
jgi:TraC-like protein